jgi:hypothetical protein
MAPRQHILADEDENFNDPPKIPYPHDEHGNVLHQPTIGKHGKPLNLDGSIWGPDGRLRGLRPLEGFNMPVNNRLELYFPVKTDPTVNDAIKAFRPRDYAQFAGITVACWGYGFLLGHPARFAHAALCSATGMTFAGIVVLRNSAARLQGKMENFREQEKFGLASWEEMEVRASHNQGMWTQYR